MSSPVQGAVPFLQKALATGQCTALVTQNPDGTLQMCIDIGPGVGELYIPILEGDEGESGNDQYPLIPMPDIFDTPADLPGSPPMSNSAADYGKFWIIVQSTHDENPLAVGAYIWYGTDFSPSGYRYLPFGSQGIPGYYGYMIPSVTLVDAEEEISQIDRAHITGSGTAVDPWKVPVDLAVPPGPFGPQYPLFYFPDVYIPGPPELGAYFTYEGGTAAVPGIGAAPLWTPTNFDNEIPAPFTVPQSAFYSKIGIDFSLQNPLTDIAAFTIPSQAFAYKPCVFGQIRVHEFSLSTAPLHAGIEVLLYSGGTANGELIARGYGNSIDGVTRIMPHTSAPEPVAYESLAMTPGNSVNLVEPFTSATIVLYIINDGLLTVYDYNPTDAQLFVFCCPATNAPATLTGLVSAIQVYGGTPGSQLQQAIEALLTGVRQEVLGTLDNVGVVLHTIQTNVTNLFDALGLGPVVGTVENIVSQIESFAGTITSPIQTALNNLASSLGLGSIGATIRSVTGGLSGITGLLSDFAKALGL